MTYKVAACIVLYHPSLEVIANIASYYQYVDYLIAIDNSEHNNEEMEAMLKQHFPNGLYRFQNGNTGIAAALNVAAAIAIGKGYNWLLTMDQDSSFKKDDVLKMITDIDIIQHQFKSVGIITPQHILDEQHTKVLKDNFINKSVAMTSGNLLNLTAYKTVGKFEEKLFIDFVDYEYCLRLRQHHFKIIQDNNARLKHALGDYAVKQFLGITTAVSNHNRQRRYYLTRNSLFVGVKYFKLDKKFFINVLLNHILRDPLLILLYEKDKLPKLKSVYKGIVHFLSGKYGKRTIV